MENSVPLYGYGTSINHHDPSINHSINHINKYVPTVTDVYRSLAPQHPAVPSHPHHGRRGRKGALRCATERGKAGFLGCPTMGTWEYHRNIAISTSIK